MASCFLNKCAALIICCVVLAVYAYAEQQPAQNNPCSNTEPVTIMEDVFTAGSAEIQDSQNAGNSANEREPAQGVLSMAECESFVEQYYRTQSCEWQRLLDSFDQIRSTLRTAFEQPEQLGLYFEHAKLISLLYVYEGNRQCGKYDRLIQAEVQGFLTQAEKHAGCTREHMAALYMQYANYLYTKIGVPKNTFAVASALPVLYRKALMLYPSNSEAAIKLACWHIFPANETTGNYNSYIESQEEYIEELSAVDRFHAYLLYSMYYMKKYESGKGRAYLQKAADLFPHHVLLSHLYKNYQNGVFSL